VKELPANKTKIVCTIGPASESQQVMERMLLAGMKCPAHFTHFAGHEEESTNAQPRARKKVGHHGRSG
jgi:pyruvate kinase